MVWTRFSEHWVRDIQVCVIDAMQHYLNRGHRKQDAIRQTALALGLSPRRVKSAAYNEAFCPSEDEWRRVRLAYLDHLDAQAEDLAARAAAARARRKQMELGI